MPCPKCNSNNLWDDLLWWGCHDCDFMSNTVRNTGSRHDRFLTHEEYRKLKK
jgi:hypothetical protein